VQLHSYSSVMGKDRDLPQAATPTCVLPARHVAFSASAGCFPYQCGIAAFIQKNFDLSNCTFSGSSGGAWPAILLASERDVEWAMELLVLLGPAQLSKSLLGAYGQYHKSAEYVFNQIFRGVSLRDRVRNKLAISVSRIAWSPLPHFTNEIVTSFFSNADIFDCMIASSLIPFAVNGEPFKYYRGWVCVDSAVTNVTGTVTTPGAWNGGEEFKDDGDDDDAAAKGRKGSFGGCRVLVSDLLQAAASFMSKQSKEEKVASSWAAASPSSPSSPLRYRSHSSPVLLSTSAREEQGRPCLEQSKPFGLFSLGLRTSKSVASHLVSELVAWGSSSPSSLPAFYDEESSQPSSPDRSSISKQVDTSFESEEDQCWTINGGVDVDVEWSGEEKQDCGDGVDLKRAVASPLPSPLPLPLWDTPTPAVAKAKAKSNTSPRSVVGAFWNERVKGSSIKAASDDRIVLEITPWMWRPQHLLSYHLSEDPQVGTPFLELLFLRSYPAAPPFKCECGSKTNMPSSPPHPQVLHDLFLLGMSDARLHVAELERFFCQSS